jgi:hypothetical protein
LIVIAACSSKPEPVATVAKFGGHYALGAPVVAENLTVWPVYSDRTLDIGEFLTLGEAQEKGLAEVREVGAASDPATQRARAIQILEEAQDEPTEPEVQTELVDQENRRHPTESRGQQMIINMDGARVGELIIENKGTLPILVCAGTVVTGGKQDRQIGQDFVILAGKTAPVSSFCVEQGRWSASREGVETDGKFKVAKFMAPPEVRVSAQAELSQAAVWNKVALVNSSRGVQDMGTSLANASAKADSKARAAEDILAATVRGHFDRLVKEGRAPVGFAYAIDGKPVSVRTFAHTRVFVGQFASFAQAMGMEAEIAQSSAKGKNAEPAVANAADIVALVETIDRSNEELAKTAGANMNGIIKDAAGYRGTCYFETTRSDEKGKTSKERIALTRDWTKK